MKLSIRPRVGLVLAGALCLVAAACSSGGDSSAGQSGASSPPPSSATSASSPAGSAAGTGTSPTSGTASSASSAPSASQSLGSSTPVTLTFWGTYGNGGNKAQTDVLNNQLIPSFEKSHPGITVKYVDIPYDSMSQKLTTGAAGGELPDVIRSDIGWVAKFAKLGVFAQLDGVLPDWDTVSSAVYPGTLEANKWNGHYYGLPLDTNTRVLITSQQALDKAGLSKPPASFDDLKAMADKLKGSGMQLFADSGLQSWNVLPWIWSGGGDIASPDRTKASGYLDSDTNVATVQMLVDWYKAGLIPNLITGNSGATSTSDGLPGGKYATIFDGPWMRDIWTAQYAAFKPIYAPIPAGAGGSISVVGGESIVMTSSTAHKDAAMQFVSWTQSAEFQVAMAKVGQMTVVQSLADQTVSADPFYAMFADQLKTAKARLNIPDSSKVDTILNDQLTKAFKGTVSVKDALTAAAQQIDPLLTAGT